MITEIEVKNFKTLRDVKIPLAPGITVMVGANNSGKSNALAVLKLLGEVQRTNFRDAVNALGGIDSIHSRDATGGVQIDAVATFEQKGFRYRLIAERDPQKRWVWDDGIIALESHDKESDPRTKMERDRAELRVRHVWREHLRSFLRDSTVHDLSVAALRTPAIILQGAILGPDGRDVAAVLDNMAGEAPTLRDAVDETVRRAAHEVKRIVTRPGPEPGTKVLGIEEKDGRVYGAEGMSDGLLLFIGLAVAAQLKANTRGILAIEEPERGIHPRRLRDLVDHLLRLTKAGIQVVLTTHSPTLLDEFRDSPESVLIFDRDEKGTHITRLSDRPDWAKELKGSPLGELWYSGVLGGVPGR